jgi:hypothetical protein
MSGHGIWVCEYGFMHRQCRCINETVHRIPCATLVEHCGKVGPYGTDLPTYKPKHRLDVDPE